MRNLILAAALLAACSAEAQTSKSKKVNLSDGSQLVYEVADNGKTKSGTYIVSNLETKNLWMNGYYKDDKPTGTWTFFDAKYQTALKYNYNQKKVTYINNDSFKDVEVKVLSKDTEVAKGASIPIPLCSIDEFKSLASSKVHLFYDNVHDNMDVTITAHVDKDGKASYTASYPSSNEKTEISKIALDNGQFKINWIPSQYHDEAVDAEFSMTIRITPENVERSRRFRWDN